MDCRKFHRDLEDYLEEGLDFASRFGMERHAQQCISCGKELSSALRLRQMARQLEKVKAPANFESAVLNEIGRREAHGRLNGFRRLWLYGFEAGSMRRLALVSSCVAILALGAFYLSPALFHRAVPKPHPAALIPPQSAAVSQNAIPKPATVTVAAQPTRPMAAAIRKPKRAPEPPDEALEQMADREVTDADYLEFQVIGPDHRPVSVRWPNKTRNRSGQTQEEYFLRNVSH